MKKFKVISLLIFIIVTVPFVLLIVPNFFTAKSSGCAIGSKIGNTVGSAIGSFEGVTSGVAEGTEDGEQDGQSAKDTKIDYVTSISKIGRLEVLTADLKAENIHTYGDDSKEKVPIDLCKYAVIRVYEGTGIFSVDLNQAEISRSNNTVTVNIPSIDVRINVDNTKTRVLTEWKSSFFKGEAEAGFDAEGNTEKVLKEKLHDKLAETPSLKDQAKKAAENQVTLLVKAMSEDDVEVKINIVEDEIKPIDGNGISGEKKTEE